MYISTFIFVPEARQFIAVVNDTEGDRGSNFISGYGLCKLNPHSYSAR